MAARIAETQVRSSVMDSVNEELVELVRSVSPQHGGILPSEMAGFLGCCMDRNVELIVESGRRDGHSTEILGRYVDSSRNSGQEVVLVSYEVSPNRNRDQQLRERFLNNEVYLEVADGRRGIPELIRHYRRRKVAVLLDGPKGHHAFHLLDLVLPHVCFVAVHDLHTVNEDGSINGSREMARDRSGWLTDDPEFIQRFGDLDYEFARFSGFGSRNEMVQHGFCLGFFPGGQW